MLTTRAVPLLQALRRPLQGAALGLGAPLGWFVIRWLCDIHPQHPLYERWLFAYMLVGTVLVFMLFGLIIGRHERRFAGLCLIDPLTSLFNKRHFDLRLGQEVARHQREDSPMCVIMLDLDHFKKVNDTLGHQAGDVVLMAVASTLRGCVRTEDVLARVGGEEFAVVVPRTDMHGGAALAERIRAAVEEQIIPVGGGRETTIRVSLGVACMEAGSVPVLPHDLMEQADEALYRAKANGRNRVELAAPAAEKGA
ncbi:GGDEF domain-containing protein [Oleidesulfovibrio alaskensis]